MSYNSPGPWKAVKNEDNEDNLDRVWGTVRDSRRYHVCRIWGDFGRKHEPEANARLIAASPDLLAALKTLYIEEKRDDDDPILIAARLKAKAAIRKAEGGDE